MFISWARARSRPGVEFLAKPAKMNTKKRKKMHILIKMGCIPFRPYGLA